MEWCLDKAKGQISFYLIYYTSFAGSETSEHATSQNSSGSIFDEK
jgi:hypothetical protein